MEPVRLWGTAESGDVAEVVVAAHLVDELLARWPPLGLRRHDENPEPGRALGALLGLSDERMVVPGEGVPVGDDPPRAAWDLLEQTLTLFAVQNLTHLVAVHSAVVVWKGSVLLVPASSGAGKSTLTVAAAAAGATVLSDEYALVDPDDGLVTGWVRPVRIRGADGTEERIDLAVRSQPLPVGLVAAVSYDPETDDADIDGAGGALQPISSAQAVLEILANTICARTRPDASLDAALAVARSAGAVSGTRGEASLAIRDLLARMEEHTATSGAVTNIGGLPAPGSDQSTA